MPLSFRVQWIWIRINNNTVLSLIDVFFNSRNAKEYYRLIVSNVNIDRRMLSYCLETREYINFKLKVVVSNGSEWMHRSNNTSLPLKTRFLCVNLCQKRNSLFFRSDGFLPFKEEPGIPLSERTTDMVSLVPFGDLEILSQNDSIPCLATRSSQVGGHLWIIRLGFLCHRSG